MLGARRTPSEDTATKRGPSALRYALLYLAIPLISSRILLVCRQAGIDPFAIGSRSRSGRANGAPRGPCGSSR